MINVSQIIQSLPSWVRPRESDRGLLKLCLVTNAAIWGIALLYFRIAPRSYLSEMVINVPSSSSTTQIEVPGLGGTSIQSNSPYASAQDPRENYKILATSQAVLENAARQLNVTQETLGAPRIQIVAGTTVIRFAFTGKTPEEAQTKATAFYQALEDRLDELRQQGLQQREKSTQSTLGSSRQKLELAQKRLSEYRAQTGLNTEEQIKQLSTNIESLRRLRAELRSESSKTNARLNELTANLQVPSSFANDAFVLQSDPVFQEALKNYGEVSSNLASLRSRFTGNNPAVIQESAKRDQLRSVALNRAETLLNRPVDSRLLDILNLNNGSSPSARESLLRDLVIAQSDRQGFTMQAQDIDRQIEQLENRLKTLSQMQSKVDELKREMQIAETVFSSKVAQLDVDRSNVYDSYPQMQILSEPSLPKNPSSPKLLFIVVGALLSSVLVTSGLITRRLRVKSQKPRPKLKSSVECSDKNA